MAVVTLTGAAGRMAQPLRPVLREMFDEVRLMDRMPITELRSRESVFRGDLDDLDAVEHAVTGAEVVIHLGGRADEADFSDILSANILGTYHVFEAARRQGVSRVIYASSHHATGFHRADDIAGIGSPPRPDSHYGVSKVFGEAAGRLYHDKWGLEVVCLRIGVCRPVPENSDQLRTWLSQPDSVRLVRAAITTSLPQGYQVVYGFSDNSRAFWSREGAAEIGFVPEDSADDYADALGADAEFAFPFQGGTFTGADYQGGVW